ncbi:MAG: hypothetical protein CSA52_02010 [Gammaproteobacteria bacterium]|nr:MAG: hypothetical protein CSB48_07530 [Pseudomonadota bacterium]PIE38529.1 MAG: hypothetical protein CSA52_02010 [Gammaproteobacteria bacterium]
MSKTYTLEELRKMKGETDIERIKNTTEKEIMEQSISDPDTPYLTDDELKEFTTPKERKKRDEHKKDRQ